MRKFLRLRSWGWALVVPFLVAQTVADPILPYSAPIADKLSNDVAVLEAIPDRTQAQNQELNRDNSALKAYRRVSTKFVTDINILRSLYELLSSDLNYSPLLEDAMTGYLSDFSVRESALRRLIDTAPRSNARTNAYRQVNSLSNSLWRAEPEIPSLKALNHLSSAAQRLPAASNAAYRASKATVRESSAAARIGKINFVATPGNATGSLSNGILDFHCEDLGSMRREISFHVEGVTDETPATYELGIGANTATSYIKDPEHPLHGKPFEVYFNALPGLIINRSVVIVDAIKTNYIVGRFQFTGFTTNELTKVDTNQITTITNGEFQITF